MPSTLGAAIRRWRSRRGWSEKDLANCLLNDGFQPSTADSDELANHIRTLEASELWPLADDLLRPFLRSCSRCLRLNQSEREELDQEAIYHVLDKWAPNVFFPGSH
jgi:hypothetical protein